MDLKDRIKTLCKERNISMNQLEQELHFGKGYISKLGKSTPNVAKIKLIAERLNVSVDYLMDGQESEQGYYLNEETAKAAQEIFENKELKMLFDVQRDMEPDDLRALHSMALALKKKERGYNDDTGC